MSVGTSLLTLLELAKITAPTFAEALTGRITRDNIDTRIKDFGRRVVELTDMKLEVRGRDRVPTDRALVFMSNHLSHIDIPVLFHTVPTRTLRMVAKKELFRIPIWGQALRASGFVEVDRGNRSKAVESLRHAQEAIASGISIWIAPEGTRSQTGELGPLKKGGFHLAIATKTPIVPIAIRGTDRVLPSHGRSITPGVAVSVTFGAPIAVEGKRIPALLEEVRSFFVSHD